MSDSESETDENEESSNGRSSDSMIVKSRLLVHSVLGCLHKTFLYASERFITKEMFETLLQPMIDQVQSMHENCCCGLPTVQYMFRLKTTLVEQELMKN